MIIENGIFPHCKQCHDPLSNVIDFERKCKKMEKMKIKVKPIYATPTLKGEDAQILRKELEREPSPEVLKYNAFLCETFKAIVK